jgi:hypothetical protein
VAPWQQPTKRWFAGSGTWAGRPGQRTANDSSDQAPPSLRPPACRSRRAAQPRKSAQSGFRARCSYTSSVLHYIPVGRGQRDETNLGLPLEEEHDEGTTPRRPCFVHVLTHGQTPAESSATSASAEPAATVAHGLQVICEGTNPTVEYAFPPERPSHS